MSNLHGRQELRRLQTHLLLRDEVDQGLADVQAGRTVDALEGLAELKLKRKARSGGIAAEAGYARPCRSCLTHRNGAASRETPE